MVTTAYGGRRPRAHHPSRLPLVRLDVVVVLLLGFFLVGLYVPSLLGLPSGEGSGGGGSAPSLSLFRSQAAPIDGKDLELLRSQVAALVERLAAAEKETREVMEENLRLRLDNQIEQANLKSLTKAKNEEIKALKGELEGVRKELQGANDKDRKEEGDGDKRRIEELERELQAAKGKLERAAASGGGDAGHKKGGAAAQEQKEDGGAKAKKADDGKGGGFLSKQLISVPEPQPLNAHWLPLVKSLFELALKDPAALLKKLDEEDPLGVGVEAVDDFECPAPAQRLTQPDLRRMEIAAQFRAGKGFVFFQHLRKAGGTGFCDLAQRSMPGRTPAYYCMPDQRGTLATPPWNTSWLLETMEKKRFRIAANEWDAFPRSKFAIADAVFTTVLRDPTDRWFSQYRFEHVEHRDGGDRTIPFADWYKMMKGASMGANYYLKTFHGRENPPDEEVLRPKGPKGVPRAHGDFYWSYHKFAPDQLREWAFFAQAVDTLRRFHLVLVLEWLNDGDAEIERVLGWTAPPRQVLPHETQAQRAEKKSKRARELLPAEVFAATREENVLDHLFYHVGRRIFLERFACARVAEGEELEEEEAFEEAEEE